MAVALAVSNICQCQFWSSDNEQAAVNTVHFLVTAVGGSPATDLDFANTLDTAIAATYKPLLTSVASYKGTTVRILNHVPLPVVQGSSGGQGIGTAGTAGLPRQNAGLLSLKTDFAGPGHRGRLYLPFPDEADSNDPGVPIAGYRTKALAFAAALDTFVTVTVGGRTASVDWVVYHHKGAGPPATFPVTSYLVPLKWATQRKRGSFGRSNASPFG